MRAKIRKFALSKTRQIMVFNIEDKVRFLNDVGGGVITRIINPQTVMVQTDDGFEVPTAISELVKANPDNEKRIVPQDEIVVKPAALVTKSNKGEFAAQLKNMAAKEVVETETIPLQLAIVPKRTSTANDLSYSIQLINEGDMDILYTFHSESVGMLQLIDKGSLEAGVLVELCVMEQKDLISFAALHLQILFFADSSYSYPDPLCFTLSLGGINLQQKQLFKANQYFDEAALILPITDNRFSRATYLSGGKAKIKANFEGTTPKPIKQETPDVEEIDLHIDEILDNYSQMSPSEILDVQMARFRTTLEGAINSKTKRIVFIHGVGNGKLKFDLRKALEQDYPRLSFQDASFAEYGYGATMVMLRK